MLYSLDFIKEKATSVLDLDSNHVYRLLENISSLTLMNSQSRFYGCLIELGERNIWRKNASISCTEPNIFLRGGSVIIKIIFSPQRQGQRMDHFRWQCCFISYSRWNNYVFTWYHNIKKNYYFHTEKVFERAKIEDNGLINDALNRSKPAKINYILTTKIQNLLKKKIQESNISSLLSSPPKRRRIIEDPLILEKKIKY